MVSNSFLLFATFGQRILSRLVLVPFLSLLYYACLVSLSYLFDIVINSPTKFAISAGTRAFVPANNARTSLATEHAALGASSSRWNGIQFFLVVCYIWTTKPYIVPTAVALQATHFKDLEVATSKAQEAV